MPLPFAAALLLLSTAEADIRPIPVRLPPSDRNPALHEGLPNVGSTPTDPIQKRFFGLGIGFETRGTSQGIGLERVVSGSPAERAGIVAGTVVAEINGVSTMGRSAEECTRLVRDSGSRVVLRFYDPATLKLRTRTLEKDWFVVPNLGN